MMYSLPTDLTCAGLAAPGELNLRRQKQDKKNLRRRNTSPQVT